MAALQRPTRRLVELAEKHGNSIAMLERVIGRGGGYLRRRLDDEYRLDIRPAERATLARFFGVDVGELGG